jgi:protein O-mannosyl-transferase
VSPRPRALPIGLGLLLFALVVWAFLPALRNGFIEYDDALFVTSNPEVQRGLTWAGVRWAFCTPVAANWHPLTVLSHMLDCQVYGLNPWGHHLTNVLLHAFNVVLLFLIFRHLTGTVWRCAVLAALFGLHPLRVESVAWVSERKDVLSACFWLLTLLAYAQYVTSAGCRGERGEAGGWRAEDGKADGSRSTLHAPRSMAWYLLTLLLFALGLMCKPMLVTLPFVLLLLDFWPLQRFELTLRRSSLGALLVLVREKVPFFLLSAVFALLTLLVQRQVGAVATNLSLRARAENALVSYLRYLGKVFWPTDLSVFYPHPRHWPAWQVLASAAVLVAISAAVLRLARRQPYWAFGWLWFCGVLVPVIGLVQVGSQSMADRYSYVPMIGLLLMLVWGMGDLAARGRWHWLPVSVAAVVTVLVSVSLTRRQIDYWRDGESLFTHALAVTDANGLASHNLGLIYYNLGVELACKEAFDQAIPYYEKALRLDPGKDDAHRGLGYALLRTQRIPEAVREYAEAVRLKPDPEAHNALGNLLVRQGRVEEAIAHCQEALRLTPNYSEAHYNLGVAWASQGHYVEAAAQLREALRLKADYPEARQMLVRVLAAQAQLGLPPGAGD